MNQFEIDELTEQCKNFYYEFDAEKALAKIVSEKYSIHKQICRKHGFASWPTFVIVFNYNQSFSWYGMLALSLSDDFNMFMPFSPDFTLSEIEKLLLDIQQSKNWFEFFRNDNRVSGLENLSVKMALNYSSYLKSIGVDFLKSNR